MSLLDERPDLEVVNDYGVDFPEGVTQREIEMFCYKHDIREEGEDGRLTKFEHFQNFSNLFWNFPGSPFPIMWNDWLEEQIDAMVDPRYTFVGIAGCGSSGKSYAGALYGMGEYLASPFETLILMTSTTLRDAKKRIWGSVTELWNVIEDDCGFGRMVASKGMIIGKDMTGKWNEKVGLTLVPAEPGQDDEAAAKLIGQKQKCLRLIADELPDLGESVLTAGEGNLTSNLPDYKMVGLGNPNRVRDPFGKFCKPDHVNGYQSVSIRDHRWTRDDGIVIRYNAEDSPNIRFPGQFPFLTSQHSIDIMHRRFGEDSRHVWRFAKGMWLPDGNIDSIYSENELENAETTEVEWDGPTVLLCALDPAFVNGGDRPMMIWGRAGLEKGKHVLMVLGHEVAYEGVSSKEVIAKQVMDSFRQKCKSLKVRNNRAGFDSTGGGIVFGQWLEHEWSPDVKKVNFGGKPMERQMTLEGEDELDFHDRVSQLWVQPKSLIRSGQIRGLTKELTDEMIEREFHERSGKKVRVETKKDMKVRTGESPDLSDAFMILVEVAILNRLLPFEEIKRTQKKVWDQWKKMQKEIAVDNPEVDHVDFN